MAVALFHTPLHAVAALSCVLGLEAEMKIELLPVDAPEMNYLERKPEVRGWPTLYNPYSFERSIWPRIPEGFKYRVWVEVELAE